MMVVSIPTLLLVLISVSRHLQRSDCLDSSEEKNSQMYIARCEVTRCNGLVGLWLRLCLETLCSSSSTSPSSAVDSALDGRQEWMPEAPQQQQQQQRQLQTNKEFRDYINKERLKESSANPTPNDELFESARDPNTPDNNNNNNNNNKGSRSMMVRKTLDACLSFCGRLTARLPPDAAASCVLQVCSDRYSSDSAGGGPVSHLNVRKRWGSRVCMDNHCGTVEKDIQAYIMCGMSFCA